MPTPQSIIDDALKYGKEIGMCIWPFLKPHVDYWWCFDKNIQELRDGIRELGWQIDDIRQKIVEAQLRVEILGPGVAEWLMEAPAKLEKAETTLPNDNIPETWKLISRYSMGKSAKKAAEEIANHRNKGNFIRISYPALPASMAPTFQRQTRDFESRKRKEEEIMKFLRDSSISTIAICGMGGVGKTEMAHKIRKRVEDENLFKEVIMVVVSQQVGMPTIQKEIAIIQKEIAELLGLTLNVESESARARQLCTRLMDENTKLIIFDGVWKSFKLDDLGVTLERCKILLTTRFKDICKGMKAQKVIEIEVLTKEEAWSLFKENAGDCVEDPDLNDLAEKFAEECNGLPITLVQVGQYLNDQQMCVWRDCLSQLRQCSPIDLPEALRDVYNCMKLSYDCIYNENERKLFLLCCLFPEDYKISVEQLSRYSMGLGIFDGITSVKDVRDRTGSLVESLKNRFLLIDGHEELHVKRHGLHVKRHGLHVEMTGIHVKMHHDVRRVAIYIGSKERNGFLQILAATSMDSPRENSSDGNCNWMSLVISNEQQTEVPVGSRYPNLRLLMMLKDESEVCHIKYITFEGIKDLNVLFFSAFTFGSLPPNQGLLKYLRTLYLYYCAVENISVIGQLAGLKILSCYRCHKIKELPEQIGRLKHLRLLELYNCKRLRTITFNIISRLTRLEELKILRSFRGWEAEKNGGKRRNAAVTELGFLDKLACLDIEISDSDLAGQEVRMLKNLVKYRIHIAGSDYHIKERDYEKAIHLNLPSHITVAEWIQKLVRNTEYLCLEGDGSNNFNLAGITNLKNLRFQSCSTVKKLVKTSDYKIGTLFPWLESLTLRQLNTLEELCDGTIPKESSHSFRRLEELQVYQLPKLTHLWKSPNQSVSLCRLKSIKIVRCSNLRYLFSESMARRSLSQLEVLDIKKCHKLELVFWDEITDNTRIKFPKLKKLALNDLPNLTAFCEGVEIINSFSPLNSELPHVDASSYLLCNQKVEMGCLKILKVNNLGHNITNIWCDQMPISFFNNLEELRINAFNGISSLMSYSTVKNLVNLKSLVIRDCKEMVEVIDGDDQVVVDINCLFRNLSRLQIQLLPKLTSFWQWNQALKLPLLEEVRISNCPVMETFTLGFINTPNILLIEVNNKEIENQKDLNDIIRHIWTESKIEKQEAIEPVRTRDCPVMEKFSLGSQSILNHQVENPKDLNHVIPECLGTSEQNKDEDIMDKNKEEEEGKRRRKHNYVKGVERER